MPQHTLPLTPGLMIGAALAGFFDGIVLHQVLQWHHMICIEAHCAVKSVETLQRQNFTDGLFHAVMLLLLVAGLAVLIQVVGQGRRFSPSRFWGAALIGAGAFNVVEGLIDHHLLEIHHVRFGPDQVIWDGGFLGLSLLIGVAGLFFISTA